MLKPLVLITLEEAALVWRSRKVVVARRGRACYCSSAFLIAYRSLVAQQGLAPLGLSVAAG
jgi:hypothetical protein